MRFYIYLMMVFASVSAFCSDMNFMDRWHSSDESPQEGQLYMIFASEYGFDHDCQATFIFQQWGCEDPYRPGHQRGWFEADQELLLSLIKGGSRVVFLPNGKEDLPYLNLDCTYLHTPPEMDQILEALREH